MINISDLNPHDATVDVQERSSFIIVNTSNPICLADLKQLNLSVTNRDNDNFLIHIGNYDSIALAERIALTWEVEGLKVRRLYEPFLAAKRDVQSFILV